MNILQRIINKLLRFFIVKKYKRINQSKNISIISSNCIGRMIYHDLGLKFNSPTINLYFSAEDYIKFLENLEYYLSLKPIAEFNNKYNFPIGKLGDLTIFFVHYSSPDEAINKWEERKKRIDFNNLLVLNTYQNGMTREMLKKYLLLPYRKICYVNHKDLILNNECIYIPNLEDQKDIKDLITWSGWNGYRLYDRYINIIKLINKNES